MKENQGWLTVGDVARRSGYAPSALRFYQTQGLIEAARTGGGQRRYRRDVLRRLAFVRAARNVGLSLEEIAQELHRLPNGRTPTTSDWARISKDWQDRLNAQIQAIEALRDRLTGCIGCGCLSLKSCVLNNPDDVLADSSNAPGAALLPALLRRKA
ncbi:MAG: redox-sensitive transcriptional activator SoxR [Actinomycetota bacterium]|nr:redox-sensitive transcriptional activator SoxR [Actinomycetota bacterium]